ncbi:MAG TPA: hypothetical protein VLT83_02560 [Opitutaceae bacterium]|nr:hypothetical protein [Opitutaceae bacterium]
MSEERNCRIQLAQDRVHFQSAAQFFDQDSGRTRGPIHRPPAVGRWRRMHFGVVFTGAAARAAT